MKIKQITIGIISLIILSSFSVMSAEARSGCCSWHGGVCGCGCCDGTALSSTCAPYYPACSQQTPQYVQKVYPTAIPTQEPIIILPTDMPIPTLIPTFTPTQIPTSTPTLTKKPTRKNSIKKVSSTKKLIKNQAIFDRIINFFFKK